MGWWHHGSQGPDAYSQEAEGSGGRHQDLSKYCLIPQKKKSNALRVQGYITGVAGFRTWEIMNEIFLLFLATKLCITALLCIIIRHDSFTIVHVICVLSIEPCFAKVAKGILILFFFFDTPIYCCVFLCSSLVCLPLANGLVSPYIIHWTTRTFE